MKRRSGFALVFLLALAVAIGQLSVPGAREVTARPAEDAPRKFAFLIGVSAYDNKNLANLSSAERDITELEKELRAGGYDEVFTLLGSAKGENKATAENCRKAFQKLLARKLTKRDLLVVALAGHGQQTKPSPDAKESEPFFCPKDADPADATSLIAINDWLDLIDQKGAGTNLLLVDACRSDPDPSRGRSGGIDGNRIRLPKDPNRDPNSSGGTVVFFACSRGQQAYESEKADGGLKDSKGGHGVFFHFVLKGLRGEARNERSQKVTWDRLVSYVKEGIDQEFETLVPNKTKQTPHAVGTLAGSADLLPPPAKSDEVTEPSQWKGQTRNIIVRTLKCGDTTMEFVKIPAGSFKMGSPESDKDAESDEKPQHTVTFTKPLWVAKYPVTKGQFAAFVKAKGHVTEAETDKEGAFGFDGKSFVKGATYSWKETGWAQTDRHPVVNVTWNDAAAFCGWLSSQNGIKPSFQKIDGKWDLTDYKKPMGIRLLTEAEYEYATRGGETSIYFPGDKPDSLKGFANVGDQSLKAKKIESRDKFSYFDFDDEEPFTSRVGKYSPNGFGLYDMTGNVFSWCADGYDPKLYSRGNVTDPGAAIDSEHKYRVLRGGSWDGSPGSCRAAYRSLIVPGFRRYSVGFRVVLDL